MKKYKGAYAKMLNNYKDLNYKERLIVIQSLQEKAKREYYNDNKELAHVIAEVIEKLYSSKH